VAAPSPRQAPPPLLRGWLHLSAAVIWAVLAVPILERAHRLGGVVPVAIFLGAMEMVFISSTLLHRVAWSEQGRRAMRRIDHGTILLGIAGTGTAVIGLCLSGTTRTVVLWAMWIGALGGILIRQAFLDGPGWAYALPYVVLSWSVLVVAPPLVHALGGWGSAWLFLGGIAYTAGAICLGLKWPNPWPGHFGYHEVFHTGTLVGAGAHWIVVFCFALPYAAR